MAAGFRKSKEKVYKIFNQTDWQDFQASGRFSGSADDLRDGFILLSKQDQVVGVIEKFFKANRPVYIAEFSGPRFLEHLRWELSGSN